MLPHFGNRLHEAAGIPRGKKVRMIQEVPAKAAEPSDLILF